MGESLLEKLDKEDGYSLLFDKGEVKRKNVFIINVSIR